MAKSERVVGEPTKLEISSDAISVEAMRGRYERASERFVALLAKHHVPPPSPPKNKRLARAVDRVLAEMSASRSRRDAFVILQENREQIDRASAAVREEFLEAATDILRELKAG